MAGFLAINIILNNSVDPSLLGAANGLGVAMTASGRFNVFFLTNFIFIQLVIKLLTVI